MADRPRTDLRQPALGLSAWAGGLSGLLLPWWCSVLGVVVLVIALVGAARLGARGVARAFAAGCVVFAAVAVAGTVRLQMTHSNSVAVLARSDAAVRATLVIISDPRRSPGRYSDFVTVRARVVLVEVAGSAEQSRATVLVVGDESWTNAQVGESVRAEGRLQPSRERGVSAVLRARRAPVSVARPAWWWRGADRIRGALRESVSSRPDPQRALVPALVVGDDTRVGADIAADFRTTGLTHLMAVSGTNLTLLIGFVLTTGRWLGVRGRWHYVLGAASIAGFVFLARPEPSVLRAAVMGAVGLVALGPGGSHGGGRALGIAVTALLLVDPWLAVQPGFTLSVLATGGIVYLAPSWREALQTWLPRWLAEAIAVPSAAQIACTPVVAALSGRVSLVAVGANLLAAPAVGPATVIGLIGGLVGLVAPALADWCGALATWCVAWIVWVARHGAGLPTPDLGWATGPLSLTVLGACCVVLACLVPYVWRRPWLSLVAVGVLALAMLVRPPTPGWPPPGWVAAVCDVGQGDAVVLRSGPASAVVVDTGPEPRPVDRCLSELRVDTVPLLVLTHFHADHVGGVAGVLRGREVEGAIVTTLYDPPATVDAVSAMLAAAGVSSRPVRYAETETIGAVSLQVVWPRAPGPRAGPGDGSTANNSSVVLVAKVRDVTILLTGDVEPAGQAAIAAALPDLHVDVLKVPHHGSRFQDLAFLTGLQARVAVTSVGADNDYGHPAAATLTALSRSGARVLRTDRDGDVVIAEQQGRLVTFASS